MELPSFIPQDTEKRTGLIVAMAGIGAILAMGSTFIYTEMCLDNLENDMRARHAPITRVVDTSAFQSDESLRYRIINTPKSTNPV